MAALTLSSCGIVDSFSGRAVGFNSEAEQAQQQALLLNIVRASLRRPMQFTTLSSITGTASESGSQTLTIPFGESMHRPKGAVSPDVFGITGSLSGGPTFTVPVLDTQEFYQGELKPLTGQEYRFFLDEGISRSVLFYAFIDHISLTVSDSNPAQKFEFHNYVGSDFDLDQFEAVADYLLALGLDIEQMHRAQIVGPPISAAQLHDLKDITQLTTAGLHLTPVRPGEKPGETKQPEAPRPAAKPAEVKPPGLYQIEKDMVVYRPCFDPPPGLRGNIHPSLLCGSKEPPSTEEQAQTDGLVRTGGFLAPDLAARIAQIRAAYVAKLQSEGQAATAAQIAALPPLPATARLQVRLYMRSTEAIMHHLGSIAARYLYKTGPERRVIQVKIGEPYLAYPTKPCAPTDNPMSAEAIAPGYHCESMFVLTNEYTGDSPLSVDYDHKTFYVASDTGGGGRTMPLLDLVKQLLALHTSAKELPASNVLNIIGGGTP
ncbi:MAG TPA: hypothetical protein VGR70_14855 [Stellaceae bacterium]|nr:hypothetical protein [Stellaceae bacterium]